MRPMTTAEIQQEIADAYEIYKTTTSPNVAGRCLARIDTLTAIIQANALDRLAKSIDYMALNNLNIEVRNF
jgi:predicted hydrolase (HD superfamily)